MDIVDSDIEKEYFLNKVFCTIVVFAIAIGACSVAFSKLTENMTVSKDEHAEALRMVSEATKNGTAISLKAYGEGVAFGKLTKGDYEKIKKAYEDSSK